MKGRMRRKSFEVILRDGKPRAVIVDIKEYEKILERLEDKEDLEILKKIRKEPLKFRKLKDFLKDYKPGV